MHAAFQRFTQSNTKFVSFLTGSVWPGKCKSIDEICAELSWPWDNMKDKQDKQMTTEGSQTIDCSELMEAPKAAQEQHGLSEYFFGEFFLVI